MNTNRKQARDYLNSASLTSFWDIVREAKISDSDKEIIELRFINGLSVVQISQKLFVSPEKVNRVIAKTYEKVSNLIQ